MTRHDSLTTVKQGHSKFVFILRPELGAPFWATAPMTQDPKSGAGRGGAKETIRVLWRAERRKYGSLECPFTAACRSVLSILSHDESDDSNHGVHVCFCRSIWYFTLPSNVPFLWTSVLRLSVDFYFDQVLNPPESQLIGSNQSCDLFRLDQRAIWLDQISHVTYLG